MKIPRDVLGSELVKALKVLGYSMVRQRGSHISIATEMDGPNQEVIPNHRPIKTGTLSGILKSISTHHGMSVEELLAKLDL
jgi:predicted RNA binding protein YcfA (HicA-like mRNA interferase family)